MSEERDIEIVDWISRMDILLDDDRYEFAWSEIEGIRDTINSTDRITKGQKRAITNIEESVDSW